MKKPSVGGLAALAEIILTTAQAAALLDLSGERIRQLAAQGYIETRGKGRYPLIAVVQGYARFLRDEDRKSTKVASLSRVQDARARELEIKIAERERRLVNIDEATGALDEIVGAVRGNLSAVAARCTRDLQLRKTIETEIDTALNGATKLLRAQAHALRTGGDPVADEAGEDAGSVGR